MKKRVNLSAWSSFITSLALIVMLVALYNSHSRFGLYAMSTAIIILTAIALFYMPMSISVKDGMLNINRPLRIKSIPLSQIESAAPCPPTMAEKPIFGSGGWFGYWGWFSEPSIGKYFAYYGKASDCFLVTLKDGKKYILGCDSPKEITDFIKQNKTI